MTTPNGKLEQSQASRKWANSFLAFAPARWLGIAAIIGALLMVTGGVLATIAGSALDSALDDGTIAAYLVNAAENEGLLVVYLSLTIAGATILAGAGAGLAGLGDQTHPATPAARTVYFAAAPLAIVACVAWLALIRLAGSAEGSATVLPLAETIGWVASRVFWVATVFLVGLGPAFLSLSGRGTWVPRWLGIWSIFALFGGLLTTVAFFVGGLTTYGALIVPVGLGWIIAAGITALRFE